MFREKQKKNWFVALLRLLTAHVLLVGYYKIRQSIVCVSVYMPLTMHIHAQGRNGFQFSSVYTTISDYHKVIARLFI